MCFNAFIGAFYSAFTGGRVVKNYIAACVKTLNNGLIVPDPGVDLTFSRIWIHTNMDSNPNFYSLLCTLAIYLKNDLICKIMKKL